MKTLTLITSAALVFFSISVSAAEYILGVVPQAKSQKLQSAWRPIINEFKKQGINIKFVGAPSIPEFEKRLKAGKYDIAYMNPYHLLMANKSQGYMPIARDASKKLQGILVVRKDRKVSKVEDLNNSNMAFPAPNALGASLLMRAELAEQHGMNLHPTYVRTHTAVYRNIASGNYSAGGGVMRTFNKQPQSLKNKLKIVYRTQEVAPHPIAVHPRVKKADAEKIKQIFLKLGETARGRALLSKIPIKHIGEANLSDYSVLQSLNLEKFAK
jgi:phosphonate transport system substrate-binding protein